MRMTSRARPRHRKKLLPIESGCTTIARESDSVLRVSENANQPPTDIAMLQARLATVLAERDAVIAERDQAQAQNHRL